MKKITIKIKTENAAFEGSPEIETARILQGGLMKKYVISEPISKSGGNPKSTDAWDFYEDFIEFECACDDDAISYAEALQQRHDSLFLEKFPEEVNFTNWDFAPCYINHIYEIGASGDLFPVE